jgi:hypothetical protein
MSLRRTVVLLIAAPALVLAFTGLAMADKGNQKVDLPDTRSGSLIQPPNDTCDGAIDVGMGGLFNDDTSEAIDDYNPRDTLTFESCTGYGAAGPDVVYKVVLAAGQKVVVTMTTSGWDDSVYLITDCDDPAGSCVAGSDLYPTGSNFSYCSIDGGTYYIICDGYSAGAYGTFTLDVSIEDCFEEGCCGRYTVVYDFNMTDDFVTDTCGASPQGMPVWQWGLAPEAPEADCDGNLVTNVLGTIVGGSYVANSGEKAIVGPVDITDETWCMELCHYYDIEVEYDGANVKISTDGGVTWSMLYPDGGYPYVCNSYAACLFWQEVFGGNTGSFVYDCFDLTPYIGETVMIGFFFGSDSSVQYDGWYIKWLKFGTDVSATAPASWGTIKSMFN